MAITNETAPLLPAGLYDLLPAQAEAESVLVGQILAHFRACSYQQLQPPLMEFESTLFAESGGTLPEHCFRAMDPLSQQMLAIRADMTMQIARIAATQLRPLPRPLRLCYAGQTLRTLPDPMRATRQFRQIGLELIGTSEPAADVEIIQTAIAALARAGVEGLSVDLALPPLLPVLLAEQPAQTKPALLRAISHKDVAAIEAMDAPLLAKLASITGPYDRAREAIAKAGLPAACQPTLDALDAIVDLLRARMGDALQLTLDPVEMRGFGYYSGISFSLFHPRHPRELGRGGRYVTPAGEAATGFTFYGEDILPNLPPLTAAPSLLLPRDTPEPVAQTWREAGYQTRYALTADDKDEAARSGCRFRLDATQQQIVEINT